MDEKLFHQSLPKKRMGAGVLFNNVKSEFLFVKTTYKDHWTLPGGVVNKNESPYQACIREVKEEIGLNIRDLRLLCVDYRSYPDQDDESLQFVFYGGILNSDQIDNIRLQPEEITKYYFFDLKSEINFSRGTKERLPICLEAIKNNTPVYLENGTIIK